MPDELDPKRELDDLRDQLQSISFSFKSSMNDIIDTIREVNRSEGRFTDFSLRNIREISFNIDKIYGNINGNIGKAIKGENIRKNIEKEVNKIIEIHKKLVSDISILEKEIGDPSISTARSIQLQNAVNLLKEQEKSLEGSLALQRNELTQADLFRKKLMPIAGILKGLGKIPVIGDMLNVNRGIEKATEAAQKGKGTVKVFAAGMAGAGGGILQTFSKFASIIGIIEIVIGLVKFFVGAMFQADKQVTLLAKSFGIAKGNASLLRDILIENKKGIDDIFFTTENQVQATGKLNEVMGTSVMFSKDFLLSQIQLTKEIGLTEEEASNLNKIFELNNVEGEKGRKSIIQQVINIDKQRSVSLNYKKVLQDVSKLSGEALTNYGLSVDRISEAVAKTEALGISMDQAQKMSESLLNFESSISNELEAELLLGKDLNLEKARYYALIGDSAKAADELLHQGVDLNKWEKLNVIQKKAYAQSIGLSVEEMSNALIQQTNLNKLDIQHKKILEDKVKSLREAGRTDEANNLMKSASSADQIDKGLRSLSIQDKFNQALEKAKEIFSNLVDGGTLDRLTNKIVEIVNSLSGITLAKQTGNIETQLNEAKKSGNVEAQKTLQAQYIESLKTQATGELGLAGYTSEHGLGSGVLNTIALGIPRKIEEKNQRLDAIKKLQGLGKLSQDFGSLDLLDDDVFKNKIKPTIDSISVEPQQIKTQQDFIMKGDKITPFRKDDLIMGGTSLMGNSKQTDEMVSLLRQIADGIKKGGVILMDGQKVGTAIARGSYNSA